MMVGTHYFCLYFDCIRGIGPNEESLLLFQTHMRDDIDTDLVLWTKETTQVYNALQKFLGNKTNVSLEDWQFSIDQLEQWWDDDLEDMVGNVRAVSPSRDDINNTFHDNETAYILKSALNYIDQSIYQSYERYRDLYSNGIFRESQFQFGST